MCGVGDEGKAVHEWWVAAAEEPRREVEGYGAPDPAGEALDLLYVLAQ